MRFNASLANFAGLYVLVDGTTKIADGWADLVDEDLDHPIDQDEAGLATRGFDVWSNTEPSGNLLFANKHCTNWIISMGGTNKGGIGSSAAMSDQWSASGEATCSTPLHLYCFED